MNASPRLLEVTDSLTEAGLPFLIMGGHAVRHYGVDRNTFDFDFTVSSDHAKDLAERLRATRLFSGLQLVESVSWRSGDFCRFQIGVLPTGKEEWLEFWFHNHLLAPFAELYERREEATEAGRKLCFLSLADLIRSKETERDDDWSDVRLLEEVLDQQNLARATSRSGRVLALSQLRTRRGFERGERQRLFVDPDALGEGLTRARHPVTCAYLLPFLPGAQGFSPRLDPAVDAVLRRVAPGTARHLALVEAVRLAYQRAAKEADRADKERHGK